MLSKEEELNQGYLFKLLPYKDFYRVTGSEEGKLNGSMFNDLFVE